MKWTHLTMANHHILLIISFLYIISDLRRDNFAPEWTNETNQDNLNVDRFLGWFLVCENCLAMGITLGKRKNNRKIDMLLLKQIITFDIRPEGDNPHRTLGCKLGSDWLIQYGPSLQQLGHLYFNIFISLSMLFYGLLFY